MQTRKTTGDENYRGQIQGEIRKMFDLKGGEKRGEIKTSGKTVIYFQF